MILKLSLNTYNLCIEMKTEYILELSKADTKQLIKQAERAGYHCELEYLHEQIKKKIIKGKKK